MLDVLDLGKGLALADALNRAGERIAAPHARRRHRDAPAEPSF
ncbi:hypothetical protein O1L44_04810 [Streptomyces noursei]|nr:hypothetical protein [Streptomyces noursei]